MNPSQETQRSAHDETGVHALMQRLNEAWAQGDADAYARLFTQDATYIAFDGSLSEGPQAIAEMHRPLFASFLKGSRLAGQSRDVRFLTPDVALVQISGAVVRRNQRRPSRRALSVQTTVVVRQEDRWLIAAFQNTRYRPWTATLPGRVLLLFAPRPGRV